MKTPEDVCPDLPDWPERWAGLPEDIPYGKALLGVMRPFMQHIIAQGCHVRTIQRHMDNLWLLGGEIIRDVSLDEEYDSPPMNRLMYSIGPDDGPLSRHCYTEVEQKSFDETCRQLYRFLFKR